MGLGRTPSSSEERRKGLRRGIAAADGFRSVPLFAVFLFLTIASCEQRGSRPEWDSANDHPAGHEDVRESSHGGEVCESRDCLDTRHVGEPEEKGGVRPARSEHSGPDDHSGTIVELDAHSEVLAGIALAEAATGHLMREIILPGEVGFNEDRLAHVSPRFEGIVREVSGYLGNEVDKGDDLALIESNASLNVYPVKAPTSGSIVQKHITPGEFVSQDSRLFTIADLESVWVNLEAPAKYLGLIAEGQEVLLRPVGDSPEASGTVWYVAPIIREATRSGLVRVVLPNRGGVWRPGTFVTATLELADTCETVLVPNGAIQVLDETRVVFIPLGGGTYRAVPVKIGLSNGHHTQILAGLDPGTSYVRAGAFELKAQMTLSSLGGHAGHGH